MKIEFASHHTWFKFIAEDPLTQFGKNAAAQLRSAVNASDKRGITVEAGEVDDELLSWFIPMYQGRMGEKQHPYIIDIRAHITRSRLNTYRALVLKENGVPLGAMIFTLRKNKVSIAFRTFRDEWLAARLPASPSLYMEYQICLYAKKEGKRAITHGKDRNPYGPHLHIGLAAFKLAAGFKVRISGDHELCSLDTEAISEDTFILAYPSNRHSRRIRNAYLIAHKEDEGRYKQLTRYPSLLEVETLYRGN